MWTLLLLLGCADAPPPSPPTEAPAGEEALDEVDVLMALGYLDHAEEVADPSESGVEVIAPEQVQPGLRLVVSAHLCEADLFTHDGTAVRHYAHQPCGGWSNAELQPDGSLLVPMQNRPEDRKGGNHGAKTFSLLWLEPDSTVRRELDKRVHHDVEVLDDGDLLTTVIRRRRLPEVDAKRRALDEDILRMGPDGQERWRLSLWDLLHDDDDVQLRYLLPGARKRSRFIEVFHVNAIERMRPVAEGPLYSADNVLLTSRNQDSIWIIDTVRRELLFSWGPGILQGPHDPHLLDNGNLLVFDNGYAPRTSRVVELDPRTKKIVWRYHPEGDDAFYTEGRGSVQRLPNGNTLLADSNDGEAREVTPDGDIVWRYYNPRLNPDGRRHAIVRIRHYPADYLTARR